jgi:dimethylamine monooxygenase subunit C
MERGYWIRSKPVYSTLLWQYRATAHLVLAEGSAGGLAALKLFQQRQPEQPTKFIYLKNPINPTESITQTDLSTALSKVVPDELLLLPSLEQLIHALETTLAQAFMGLRVYVAGSEQFIWSVAKIAAPYGIDDSAIFKELTGTLARSVYCVHCKTITHQAHHNIQTCSGCGKQLFVRDHFSRRLGAYMGLMVDAESPGELPDIEEIYP